MTKPKMPDGLYISVSQLKTWLMCPRKFELKYVRGVAPAFVPVPLAFGSAIHAALAAYYGEIKTTGVPLRRDLVLDTFRASWAAAGEGNIPLQADEDEDQGALVEKGLAMLDAFYEHASGAEPPTVLAVEYRFAITLRDVDSGDRLEEKLVGSIDLLVQEESGHVTVVEHKSAAKKYSDDQLRFDIQPTAYQIAARESGLGEVGLRYQVLTKAKSPQVQTADILRDEGDEADFLRTAVGVLRAIDAGVSYPVRGWACRGCPYAHACR